MRKEMDIVCAAGARAMMAGLLQAAPSPTASQQPCLPLLPALCNFHVTTDTIRHCAVFYALWSPFMFMMGYSDPRRPSADKLYGEAGRSTRAGPGVQQRRQVMANSEPVQPACPRLLHASLPSWA